MQPRIRPNAMPACSSTKPARMRLMNASLGIGQHERVGNHRRRAAAREKVRVPSSATNLVLSESVDALGRARHDRHDVALGRVLDFEHRAEIVIGAEIRDVRQGAAHHVAAGTRLPLRRICSIPKNVFIGFDSAGAAERLAGGDAAAERQPSGRRCRTRRCTRRARSGTTCRTRSTGSARRPPPWRGSR